MIRSDFDHHAEQFLFKGQKWDRKQRAGFTLIEILVALFIFAILSIIMMTGLKNMIDFHHATLERTSKLRELQLVFLIFSRDLEQAVDRSVINAYGNTEAAFIGSAKEIIFTHMGHAGILFNSVASQLQRVDYRATNDAFVRITLPVLDMMPNSVSVPRVLSNAIREVRFQYYSRAKKRFYDNWPLAESEHEKAALPDAVRMYLTIPGWGKMSQLYVIPAAFKSM